MQDYLKITISNPASSAVLRTEDLWEELALQNSPFVRLDKDFGFLKTVLKINSL